jgi:hypothetical protein
MKIVWFLKTVALSPAFLLPFFQRIGLPANSNDQCDRLLAKAFAENPVLFQNSGFGL